MRLFDNTLSDIYIIYITYIYIHIYTVALLLVPNAARPPANRRLLRFLSICQAGLSYPKENMKPDILIDPKSNTIISLTAIHIV
jgi:hypothetical protein